MPRTRASATCVIPFTDLAGTRWRLQDQLSDAVYLTDDDFESHGFYLDVPAWHHAVYAITPTDCDKQSRRIVSDKRDDEEKLERIHRRPVAQLDRAADF